MSKFNVAQAVAELLPQMQIVVVHAKGVNNTKDKERIIGFAEVSADINSRKSKNWEPYH